MALPLNYTLNNRGDLTTAVPPVDPAGDVNLCTRHTQFVVSSKALALGSKVFHAMFLPAFQEGVQLQEHIERKEVFTKTLPDDHSMALHIICLVLHHQQTAIPYKISPYLLFEVAKLVDKYDCRTAMCCWAATATGEMFKRVRACSFYPGSAYSLLLCAAWLFENDAIFPQISRAMVFARYPGSFAQSFDEAIDDFMPEHLQDSLINHERQTAQTLIKGLHNLLEGLIWTHTGPHRKCDQNCLADFITCFRKVQLWPIHGNTSKPAGNMLSGLKDAFDDPLSSLVCKGSGISTRTCFEQFPQLTAINSWKGVCLKCVREGELGKDTAIALDSCQRHQKRLKTSTISDLDQETGLH